MVKVVIIDKNGDCKDIEMKKIIFGDLYKKCGFKNNNNFDKRITWKINHKKKHLFINIFAKNNGRANTENKFDFPPPIDNDLFFGNIIIVACSKTNDEDNVIDINVSTWCKIYESLMGGFENIENTDDEEEEEEEIPPELLTKHGYKKDGFIISDEDDDVNADTDDSDDYDDECDDDISDDGGDDDDISDGDEIDIHDDFSDENKEKKIKKYNKCFNVDNDTILENDDDLQEESYCDE
jgi:hypothetical protein